MTRMNKCLAFFIFSLFLAGCSSHVIFEPNELPDGYIGQGYYVPITISGGTGPIVDLSYEIHPSNSGLKLVFDEKNIIQNIYIITLPYKVILKRKVL